MGYVYGVEQRLVDILYDGGFANEGYKIYSGYDVEPDFDKMILVITTGSYKKDSPSLSYSNPVVQVSVRGTEGNSVEPGHTASHISDYLQNWWGTKGDIRFVFINHLSGPITMLPDDRMRPISVINFSMQVCPAG